MSTVTAFLENSIYTKTTLKKCIKWNSILSHKQFFSIYVNYSTRYSKVVADHKKNFDSTEMTLH